MNLKDVVSNWAVGEAKSQQESEIRSLEDRLARVRAMAPEDYVRRGIDDVCPKSVPVEVREYLRLKNEEEHFSVKADSGNEGIRLQVSQGSWEWDDIIDPFPTFRPFAFSSNRPNLSSSPLFDHDEGWSADEWRAWNDGLVSEGRSVSTFCGVDAPCGRTVKLEVYEPEKWDVTFADTPRTAWEAGRVMRVDARRRPGTGAGRFYCTVWVEELEQALPKEADGL